MEALRSFEESPFEGSGLPDPASARPADVSTEWILRPAGRPLFVFAHQDDESVLAGIIHRIIRNSNCGHFIWWTNGDGLAPGTGILPEVYGKLRIDEATDAVRRLGGTADRKADLATSEIENYRRFTHVAQGGAVRDAALEYFRFEASRMEEAVRAADPDRVFVLAWQGGHPEHDLTHVMTARAVRKLRRETGRPIPIIQCPAYEYVIACAMRFNPLFRGDVRTVDLTEEEQRVKASVFEAYPSQSELFDKFRMVLRGLGALSLLRGRYLTPESWLATEQMGVVDPDFDYSSASHRFEVFNYMGDDFEGIPIRFDSMIRVVARDLMASS